jgi:ATP-dependent helicase/nuclease subunit B
MRRAVQTVSGKLKALNIYAAKPGFLPGLIQTLDECKCYGIDARQLERAGGDKLNDLALIFSAYDMLCEGGPLDPLDRVTLARTKAKEIRFCKGVHIYLSHFTSFTPQERLLLKTLADNAASFTVLLLGDPSGPGFEPLHTTARQLSANSGQITVNSGENGRHPALAHMERHWFERAAPRGPAARAGSSQPEDASPASFPIELYAAPGEAAEVRFAAERAVGLARDEGYRWRDIAVIASDYQTYGPLIESIFPQYRVPVFSDKMDDVAGKPLSRCIRAAADCLRYGYRADDVMRLLRSGLLPVPAPDIDLFENYLRRWNPRGSRFSGGSGWTRPLGSWHSEPDEMDQTLLDQLNSLRRRISGALTLLSRAKTSGQCATALTAALEALGVPEGVAARANALNAAGETKLSNECSQMWELYNKAVEQCAVFLQDEPMDCQEFCELLLLVLSGYTVGSIPASLDSLHAGDQSRYPRLSFPVVIYIGASHEKVPARSGGDGFLSAEEREALAGVGCEMPPDPPARIKRELYNLYTACTLPSKKLILSYSKSPKEDAPAEAISRLSAIFGLPVTLTPPPSLPSDPLPIAKGPLSAQSAAALYGSTLRLSASRVEAFSKCPFLYFCQYGLRTERRAEPGFSPLDVGRELHIILEQCARYALDRGGFAQIPREELCWFAESLSLKRQDALLRRGGVATPRLLAQGAKLSRAASLLAGRLWDEFIHSRFAPLGFELSVESPEITLRGRPEDAPSAYTLRGVADRADGFYSGDTLYIRVIDYKTGRQSFSVSDVHNGLSAQMPLYLFLLRSQAQERFGAAKAEAAGILYVQTRDLLASPNAKHSGLLLDDPNLLKAMDDRLGREDGVLPVSLNQDGSFSKKSSVASPAELEDLQKSIGLLVRDTARQIANGQVSAAPLDHRESPCEHCGYRAACHFDEECDTRRPYEVKP